MSTGDLAVRCASGITAENLLKAVIVNSADCSDYFDCENKDESVESIIKRLIVEDADGNLALNVCGCECEGGGGGVLMYDVTYAELVAAIGGSTLVEGVMYRITDFATVHYFTDGGSTLADINTGANEPLIAIATSSNTINSRVFSQSYPQDIIHYDWDANNWLLDSSFSSDTINIVDGFKGVITYRHDTVLDNSTYYDYRNVKFRRWALNPAAWLIGTTYSRNDIVQDGSKIYISIKNTNLGKTPAAETEYWVEIFNISVKKYWSTWSGTEMGIVVDANDYSDYYTFGDNCYGNTIERLYDNVNSFNNIATIYNNITFGDDCYYNVLKSGCWSLSFGDDAQENQLGQYCFDSLIYNGFNGNVVGHYFSNNVVNYSCSNNQFGGIFANNYLGEEFDYNTIGAAMRSNKIGKHFKYNLISAEFQSNYISTYFTYNTIGTNFNGNSIKYNFRKNNALPDVISLDFTLATHVYGDYSCTISKRLDGTARLTYIDNSDVQQIVAATA